MKFVTFKNNEQQSYGAIVDQGIVDLGSRIGDKFKDLKALLASDHLVFASRICAEEEPDFTLEDITLLPVIPNPDKILCVGLNYQSHVKESGRSKEKYPVIFTRFPDTQMGHNAPVWKPRVSDKLDYEGELALIIGKKGRYITEENAFDHVAGYSCYNDVSVRDYQKHTHQFIPGKNFPNTGALGPWMIPQDELPDITDQTLTTRLNGEVMQQAKISKMIFSIPQIIAYCSAFTELNPGDVIATGTPGGVGFKRDPQVFMKPGDSIEIEITGIGKLSNLIEMEPQ